MEGPIAFGSCIFMMQVFFSRRQSAADVTLRFIHFQHRTDGSRQIGVDAFHTVGDVFVHCGLADAKFLRCLPHRCICRYHEFRHFHRPFLDICLQTKHSL